MPARIRLVDAKQEVGLNKGLGSTSGSASDGGRGVILAILAAAAFFVHGGAVYSQEGEIPEARRLEFKVQPNPSFQVSSHGRLIRGVMFEPSVHSLRDKMFIALRGEMDSQLCIDFYAKDGSCQATMIYNIQGLSDGNYVLKFPTREAGCLGEQSPPDVALLATTSGDCKSSQIKSHVLVGWAEDAHGSDVWIFVNAGADRIRLVYGDSTGQLKARRCQRHPTSIAGRYFDALCTLTFDAWSSAITLYAESISSTGQVERDRLYLSQ